MAKVIATAAPGNGSATPSKLKLWFGRWLTEVAEKSQSLGYLDGVGGL